jgi:hypothetical protein
MATISIYQAEDNRYYQVSVDIATSLMDRIYGSPSDCQTEYYLKISTTLRKPDNTAFSQYVIRTLADVPPGYSAATTFTELVDDYVEYFITYSEMGMSSSSSSLSSSSSSVGYSSSSSSSSVGYSSSSSTSSSSYVENWSSSSFSSSSSSSTEVRSSSSSSSKSESSSSSSSTEVRSSSSSSSLSSGPHP